MLTCQYIWAVPRTLPFQTKPDAWVRAVSPGTLLYMFRSPTWRTAGIAALFLAAALFGIASGVLFAYIGDLPGLPSLDTYSPNVTTRILGNDGAVVGELATERRDILKYSEIPPVLRLDLRHGLVNVVSGVVVIDAPSSAC